MKNSAVKVSKTKKKVKDTTPKVDQHNPGFSFRWPEQYDGPKYAYNRPFARLPKSVLFRKDADGIMQPGIWADLSISAKAVLIVLLRHANRENVSFPSQEVICAKSGINTRKTVKKACEKLQAAGLIKIEEYVTMNGRRAIRYALSNKLLSQHETDYLPSYHHHVEGGQWAMMGYKRESAQALYWAIRFFAKPRPDLEDDGEWIDLSSDDGREWLAKRKGDVCAAERGVLCDFAGITLRSYPVAMQCLRELGVVRDLHEYPDKFYVSFEFEHYWPAKVLHQYLNVA